MDGQNDLLTRLQNQFAAFDEAAWEGCASRGLLRRARKDLASGILPGILEANPNEIRIAVGEHTVTLNEGGVPKARCTCPAPACCQHMLAACLHLAAGGTPTEHTRQDIPASPTPAPPPPPAPTKPKINSRVSLVALQSRLEQMLALGLGHPDSFWVPHLRGLALRCRTEGWFRCALETHALATGMEQAFSRRATADARNQFLAMARLYALTESLLRQGQNSPREFVGTARSVYQEQDALPLVGMGAYPWETASGHLGLTALFWCALEGKFYSWSDSRPANRRGGFTPDTAYANAVPWGGGRGLKQLIGHRFQLIGCQTNPARRIGSTETSRISHPPQPASENDLPPAVNCWETFWQRPRAHGLRKESPLDAVYRFQPSEWGNVFFDEARQALMLPMMDKRKQVLELCLPYSSLTRTAILRLEQAVLEPGIDTILGQPGPGSATIFPLAWIQCGTPPKFQDLYFPADTPGASNSWQPTEPGTGFSEPSPQVPDALDIMLTPFLEALERSALTGEPLRISPQQISHLVQAGAPHLANAFHQPHSPRQLLVLRYLISLASTS